MTDPIDISALDADANRMRVTWKKMIGFATSFARDLQAYREAFPPGKYTDKYRSEWTFSRWMIAKVGVRETTALRVMQLLADRNSIESRQQERDRLREIAAEKKAEVARRKAEAAAEKERKAAARQASGPKLQPRVEPKPPMAKRPHTLRDRAAPQYEKARLAVREAINAGRRVDRARIAKETGTSYTTVGTVHLQELRKKHAPEHASTNGGGDPLAVRGHAAWAKIDQGDELWIEGVMELTKVMAEARDQFPANQDFGIWLEASKLERNKDDRAALVNLGHLHRERLRNLLKTSRRDSIQLIWRDFREGRLRSAKNTAGEDDVITRPS